MSEFQTVFKGNLDVSASRVPISDRISAEHFELEKERIFRRSWLPLKFTYDLPEPGSFAVVDVPTFNTQLLVVRGQDNEIRAFHNICRHRGARLTTQSEGCRKRFSCPYHGWTYSDTGELKGVPDESQFIDLDKSKLGLLEVAAQRWEDLLFVNFSPEQPEPLSSWLGDWFSTYSGYFADREMVASYAVEVNANWNLIINGFTEGYHTLWVHRDTLPDYQGGSSNPLRHRPYLELGRLHALYSAHRNPERSPSRLEKAVYGHARKLFPSFDVEDMPPLPPGVNPSRFTEWAYDMRELFPNTCLMTGAHFHVMLSFWPITHDRTIMRVETYTYKAERPSDRLAQAFCRVRNREVAREDIGTLERNQAALRSGVLPFSVLSNQEMMLQHHFRTADAMIAASATP